MATTKATLEERTKALELYVEHGANEASRLTGIPRVTISQWARRAGVTVTRTEQTRASIEAATLSREAKRVQMADALLVDAERLRQQLWSPAKVHHWGTTSERQERGVVITSTEFMEHEIDQPQFADQRQIMTAMAIAVDKSFVLAGDSVERQEITLRNGDRSLDDEVERRLGMVAKPRLLEQGPPPLETAS